MRWVGVSDRAGWSLLQILGLDICADTIVGDQMQRGISGGQKKRVTTGKQLLLHMNCMLHLQRYVMLTTC